MSAQRKRRRPQSQHAALPTGEVTTDFSQASLVTEAGAPHRVTLYLDGVPSSHHDLADPTYLEFKYMQWLAGMIDAWFPPTHAVRALHIGGAGCTMARYLDATRPDSHQLALEIDAKLAAHVRQWFDLPRAPQLRIRVADGRPTLESSAPDRWEVIIRDAFIAAKVPAALVTTGAAAAAHRALSADGIYLVNCADYPPLELARREVTTLAQSFGPNIALTAEPGVFSGRRHGNVIIMAAKNADRLKQCLAQIGKNLRTSSLPPRLLAGRELQAFAAGFPAFTD